ncbi:hypothetical protein NKR19_g7695 [Coniochaeta hoffmannii]|uniref:Ribonuclease H1 N-terminal domain-containing protein n=1 Tax=Coniochaeta hoffmannii TaxID=91930 RepID=A0AA38VLN9_9PEZI|nr:hypothetical protein NKR19_g7695 [Coniochaeta hoffmannii]
MVPHKRKTFYGVVRGRRAPIVSSWGVAGALVDGYGNSLHRGFETFDEAKEWMATNGCPEFRCYMPDDDGIAPAARFKGGYYAVARGRRPGIYLTWR